jgi:hypothetical protein
MILGYICVFSLGACFGAFVMALLIGGRRRDEAHTGRNYQAWEE